MPGWSEALDKGPGEVLIKAWPERPTPTPHPVPRSYSHPSEDQGHLEGHHRLLLADHKQQRSALLLVQDIHGHSHTFCLQEDMEMPLGQAHGGSNSVTENIWLQRP